eukprot:m.11053 g.11053  ORF g.11053 m.11053 type:complete len:506 (-) comp5663_c0_seq1:2869-4386(-)
MVLDITSFRPQEDPDALGPDGVRDIQRKRFKDVEVVQRISDADAAWRELRFKGDALNKLKNVCSKTVGARMKAKQPVGDTEEIPAELQAKLAELTQADLEGLCTLQIKALGKLVDAEKAAVATLMEEKDAERASLLRTVGNVLDASVPVFKDEEHNVIERTVGDAAVKQERKQYSHVDLIAMIDGVDTDRGTVAAGNRGYYLRGPAVCLETALVAFSQQFLMNDGFTCLSPPVFMRKEVMEEVAQLSQFDEELYKVTGKASEIESDTSVEEKYLIATSEQPIAAYHRDEWIDPAALPLKYVGVSECFRQEVGSHGRDTTGIFRVHQFKKVEQFVITSPKDRDSWDMMVAMLSNAERFLQLIGLPYQVVNIVSGALNLAAAKKNDVEAWFPGSGSFRELVSCSNCTDYQSRRLKIRYGRTKKLNADVEYVHMLNSTLCATTRTICCILENFQFGTFEDGGGVVVPEVLRPYMPEQYKEFIPFVKPAPIDEMAAKAAKKGGKKKGGK